MDVRLEHPPYVAIWRDLNAVSFPILEAPYLPLAPTLVLDGPVRCDYDDLALLFEWLVLPASERQADELIERHGATLKRHIAKTRARVLKAAQRYGQQLPPAPPV